TYCRVMTYSCRHILILFFFFFFLMLRRPPRSTLFPYRRSSDLRVTALQQRDRQLAATATAPHDKHARHCARLVRAYPFWVANVRSEEHTSELQSPCNLVCRLLLEKKKKLKR